jgi:hypothetical protein
MLSTEDPLETIWDSLLSQEPEQIRIVFATLDQASQRSILLHLKRMVTEPGWMSVQQQSAQFALNTLTPSTDADFLFED